MVPSTPGPPPVLSSTMVGLVDFITLGAWLWSTSWASVLLDESLDLSAVVFVGSSAWVAVFTLDCVGCVSGSSSVSVVSRGIESLGGSLWVICL